MNIKELLTEKQIQTLVANFYLLHQIVTDPSFDNKITTSRANFIARNQMKKVKQEIIKFHEELENVGKQEKEE